MPRACVGRARRFCAGTGFLPSATEPLLPDQTTKPKGWLEHLLSVLHVCAGRAPRPERSPLTPDTSARRSGPVQPRARTLISAPRAAVAFLAGSLCSLPAWEQFYGAGCFLYLGAG